MSKQVQDPKPYSPEKAQKGILLEVLVYVLFFLSYGALSFYLMRRSSWEIWASNLGYYNLELRPYRDELAFAARLAPAAIGLLVVSAVALVRRRRMSAPLTKALAFFVLVTGLLSIFCGRGPRSGAQELAYGFTFLSVMLAALVALPSPRNVFRAGDL